MFVNGVLQKICRPKREEVTRGWKKVRNEWLHDLYSSQNVTCVVKSRRMSWMGLVAHVGDK
jgi:hypothetical protein